MMPVELSSASVFIIILVHQLNIHGQETDDMRYAGSLEYNVQVATETTHNNSHSVCACTHPTNTVSPSSRLRASLEKAIRT